MPAKKTTLIRSGFVGGSKRNRTNNPPDFSRDALSIIAKKNHLIAEVVLGGGERNRTDDLLLARQAL